MIAPKQNQPGFTLLRLKNASFSKYNAPLFKGINWQIKIGESWAIAGPAGAGKTIFAEALAGKYPIREGLMFNNFALDSGTALAHKNICLVSFSPTSTKLNYKNFYYQQRYNSSDSESSINMQQYLSEGLTIKKSNLEAVTELLKIKDLLAVEVIKLSNGQTRKMLIARALLQKPPLLVLDNPYSGLDLGTRHDLDSIITELIKQGTPVIIITNQNYLPAYITHVLWLENFAVARIYSREEFIGRNLNYLPSNKVKESIYQLFPTKNSPEFKIAVQFEQTNVHYDKKAVLKNINWTVKKGDKWALTGPNGSGKTTLLSLINGDNPQAFANKITLFDRRKGSGESIWEIKKRIGFVSPELHLYFRQDSTARTIAATGFTDTLYLNRKINDTENQTISQFFSFLQIENLLEKCFLQLSTGEQRLVLLIRSMVKNPDMLIWDEPFQGLSLDLISQISDLLQAYATPEKTFILVSHYNHEIPEWITKTITLENGEIKYLSQ